MTIINICNPNYCCQNKLFFDSLFNQMRKGSVTFVVNIRGLYYTKLIDKSNKLELSKQFVKGKKSISVLRTTK